MTYCLGWKSKTAAFLIADSAVTKRIAITEDKKLLQESSFGEKQGQMNTGKYVYERTLKLNSVNKIAITFAGDADFGGNFVSLIKDNLDYGINIKTAIQYSINNYIVDP
ncbi:hypothetical protein [Methylovulum psychrotolerans]|uniref:hypothetical protein n=1 Tax=Methylovulum psychrotolerans TaxID=1704499 RepID=UPI000CDE8720|nr:hypothetical protein [Methylovulum psychrotolerans]